MPPALPYKEEFDIVTLATQVYEIVGVILPMADGAKPTFELEFTDGNL